MFKAIVLIIFFAKNIATIENKCASKHIVVLCNLRPRQVAWKSSYSHGRQPEVLWRSVSFLLPPSPHTLLLD